MERIQNSPQLWQFFRIRSGVRRRQLADQRIATTLCPGGKERIRRLMRLVQTHRINLRLLLTHTFRLDDIAKAYELFESRREGVLKVAIRVA